MWLVRRNIKPLNDVTGVIDGMTKGQLETNIPHIERKDEIGLIARSLAVFRDAAARNREMESEERTKSEEEHKRVLTVEEITRQFEAKVASLMGEVGNTISALEGDAATMRTHAETTRERAQSAAKSAGHASENVQSVAAATEELAGSVNEIGRQVSSSSEIATRAVKEAEDTNRQVKELSAAAMKIGEIVEPHPDHRRADQSAGAQRHDRIRARRRSRPWFRGRRVGSEVARHPDRQSDRGYRPPDRGNAEGDQRSGRRDRRHFRNHRRDGSHRGHASRARSRNRAPPPRKSPAASAAPRAKPRPRASRSPTWRMWRAKPPARPNAVSKAAADMAARLRGLDDEIKSFLSRMQAA